MWNDLTGNIPREIGNVTTLKLMYVLFPFQLIDPFITGFIKKNIHHCTVENIISRYS
jgi:hypothetical protein